MNHLVIIFLLIPKLLFSQKIKNDDILLSISVLLDKSVDKDLLINSLDSIKNEYFEEQDSNFFRACYQLGYFYFLEKEYDRSKTNYLLAVSCNPFGEDVDSVNYESDFQSFKYELVVKKDYAYKALSEIYLFKKNYAKSLECLNVYLHKYKIYGFVGCGNGGMADLAEVAFIQASCYSGLKMEKQLLEIARIYLFNNSINGFGGNISQKTKGIENEFIFYLKNNYNKKRLGKELQAAEMSIKANSKGSFLLNFMGYEFLMMDLSYEFLGVERKTESERLKYYRNYFKASNFYTQLSQK